MFTILGNHDWWHGNGPPVEDAMLRAGMPLLSNRHITWRRGGSTLYLAGVDDIWVGRDRLEDAMHGIPADAAVVLLAHEPDFADTAACDPRIGLQLSGHSHGGQVRIPWLGAYWYPELCRKYPEGRYQIGDMALYTNRGIGVVTLPVRFCCRPEITKFTLLPRG